MDAGSTGIRFFKGNNMLSLHTAPLAAKMLASLASMGDIFSDAKECQASVKAAQNLQVLAGMLSADTEAVANGTLMADGTEIADRNAIARTDGSLLVLIPEGFNTTGRTWTFVMDNKEHTVTFFAGECSDDESWVIAEPQEFYHAIIEQSMLTR